MINELKAMGAEERINKRIEKFGKMGFWDEVEEVDSDESIVDSNGVGSQQPAESSEQEEIESGKSEVGSNE